VIRVSSAEEKSAEPRLRVETTGDRAGLVTIQRGVLPGAIATVYKWGDWAMLVIETRRDFFKQTVTLSDPSASTLSVLPAAKDGLF